MFFVCLFDKNCIYMTSKPSIKASSKKNVGNLTLRNYLSDYAKIRKIKSSSNVSITKN